MNRFLTYIFCTPAVAGGGIDLKSHHELFGKIFMVLSILLFVLLVWEFLYWLAGRKNQGADLTIVENTSSPAAKTAVEVEDPLKQLMESRSSDKAVEKDAEDELPEFFKQQAGLPMDENTPRSSGPTYGGVPHNREKSVFDSQELDDPFKQLLKKNSVRQETSSTGGPSGFLKMESTALEDDPFGSIADEKPAKKPPAPKEPPKSPVSELMEEDTAPAPVPRKSEKGPLKIDLSAPVTKPLSGFRSESSDEESQNEAVDVKLSFSLPGKFKPGKSDVLFTKMMRDSKSDEDESPLKIPGKLSNLSSPDYKASPTNIFQRESLMEESPEPEKPEKKPAPKKIVPKSAPAPRRLSLDTSKLRKAGRKPEGTDQQ